jgi:hypothetical protein
VLAACGLLLAAGGCGGDDDSAGGSAETDLVVTVRPDGPHGPARRHHVVCPGDKACEGLSAKRLAPVPPDVACSQIYGGPQTARVQGTLEGKPLDARFSRANGCEIERWEHNAALFR